jgi:hypothetical protein
MRAYANPVNNIAAAQFRSSLNSRWGDSCSSTQSDMLNLVKRLLRQHGYDSVLFESAKAFEMHNNTLLLEVVDSSVLTVGTSASAQPSKHVRPVISCSTHRH